MGIWEEYMKQLAEMYQYGYEPSTDSGQRDMEEIKGRVDARLDEGKRRRGWAIAAIAGGVILAAASGGLLAGVVPAVTGAIGTVGTISASTAGMTVGIGTAGVSGGLRIRRWIKDRNDFDVSGKKREIKMAPLTNQLEVLGKQYEQAKTPRQKALCERRMRDLGVRVAKLQNKYAMEDVLKADKLQFHLGVKRRDGVFGGIDKIRQFLGDGADKWFGTNFRERKENLAANYLSRAEAGLQTMEHIATMPEKLGFKSDPRYDKIKKQCVDRKKEFDKSLQEDPKLQQEALDANGKADQKLLAEEFDRFMKSPANKNSKNFDGFLKYVEASDNDLLKYAVKNVETGAVKFGAILQASLTGMDLGTFKDKFPEKLISTINMYGSDDFKIAGVNSDMLMQYVYEHGNDMVKIKDENGKEIEVPLFKAIDKRDFTPEEIAKHYDVKPFNDRFEQYKLGRQATQLENRNDIIYGEVDVRESIMNYERRDVDNVYQNKEGEENYKQAEKAFDEADRNYKSLCEEYGVAIEMTDEKIKTKLGNKFDEFERKKNENTVQMAKAIKASLKGVISLENGKDCKKLSMNEYCHIIANGKFEITKEDIDSLSDSEGKNKVISNIEEAFVDFLKSSDFYKLSDQQLFDMKKVSDIIGGLGNKNVDELIKSSKKKIPKENIEFMKKILAQENAELGSIKKIYEDWRHNNIVNDVEKDVSKEFGEETIKEAKEGKRLTEKEKEQNTKKEIHNNNINYKTAHSRTIEIEGKKVSYTMGQFSAELKGLIASSNTSSHDII